jgi:hypothetical protein
MSLGFLTAPNTHYIHSLPRDIMRQIDADPQIIPKIRQLTSYFLTTVLSDVLRTCNIATERCPNDIRRLFIATNYRYARHSLVKSLDAPMYATNFCATFLFPSLVKRLYIADKLYDYSKKYGEPQIHPREYSLHILCHILNAPEIAHRFDVKPKKVAKYLVETRAYINNPRVAILLYMHGEKDSNITAVIKHYLATICEHLAKYMYDTVITQILKTHIMCIEN